MSPLLPGDQSRVAVVARVGALATLAVALGLLAATAASGLDEEGRGRLVRYVGILIAGGLSVSAPHLLFPDPALRRLQLSNPSPARLARRQLGRWMPLVAVLVVPAVVIAGSSRPLLIAEGIVCVVALGLFAWVRTATLGLRVRAWERGEAGQGYRQLTARSPALKFQVPDELVPSFALTAEIFLAGSVLSIAGRAVGGGLGTLVAPAVLIAVTLALAARQRGAFDRAFWTGNGVWSDAFQPSEGTGEGREPVAYDAVYWAPHAVRPRVWAGLVSLDRRFPLGRVAALGLGLIAAVHIAGTSVGLRAATVALYVLGVNGVVALTATDELVPGPLALRVGGAWGWAAARFLMNVRWLPPLAGVLALLVWLTDSASGSDVVVWALVDLGVAALSAGLVTLASRLRLRRLYA